jgi:hypothetical protein
MKELNSDRLVNFYLHSNRDLPTKSTGFCYAVGLFKNNDEFYEYTFRASPQGFGSVAEHKKV